MAAELLWEVLQAGGLINVLLSVAKMHRKVQKMHQIVH